MKRGLVLLDPAEVPGWEWRRRIGAVTERLDTEGIDVALVYGDVSRSDDIGYLTNLCIYWNEGVLAVPVDGEPVFLTKLSPRVHPWMRRVSTVTEIRSGRNLPELVAKFLSDRPQGTVGLVDAALWPAAVVREIAAAVPGWSVRELGGLVREQRIVPAEPELALLRHGGRVLARAAAQACGAGLPAPARIAVVERCLRRAGFLDVLANSFASTDGVTSVGVTGQYRTGWLHAARLAGTGDAAGGWPAALRAALAAAIDAAEPGRTGADLLAAVRGALVGLPAGASGWVSWVNQADLATGGEYAGQTPDTPLVAGSVVAIAVDVLFADGGYATVADTVLIGAGGAEPLTAEDTGP